MNDDKSQIETIINADIDHEMKSSYLDYAMSVIVSRALPDVRDGLKPVHRRIIYGMQDLSMYHDRPYRKSARLVGDVMGKYHPHGDTAIYDAVVRLAQDFSTRYPLADGQGNFGSIDGDRAAAMRYTEIRMSHLAEEMLRDIQKETVDWTKNFDESLKEPTVLPSRFPNLLVNGSSGIAVGMATNMAPHNLEEVTDGILAFIDNPDITLEELMDHIKGPDFPTGAMIMGDAAIKKAYKTGRGKLKLRAVVEIEEVKKKKAIIVKELPYQVNKANLLKKIASQVQSGRIEGISDLRDESNRDGMRIVIGLKRDAIAEVVLNKLYKYTQMQTTFGIINIALVDGKPVLLSLKELISHYVDHQVEVVERRTKFDLDKALARAHILEGLRIAIDNIDEIINIIRSNYSEDDIKQIFNEKYDLTDAQSQAILDMRLKRLSGLQREKLEEEYAQLQEDIKYYRTILSDPKVRDSIIKDELREISDRFSDERRTKLMPKEEDISMEDMIQEEDVVITLTHKGYVKRMPQSTYRTQNRGGRGINGMIATDDDFVEEIFVVNTHDEIIFFTNWGNVYTLRGYEIPEAGRQARGTAIVNLLSLKKGEEISVMRSMSKTSGSTYFTVVTRDGIIKKTPAEEYENIRKSGLIGVSLKDEDSVIQVLKTTGEDEIMVTTKDGYAIRFSEKDVNPTGRNTQGVRAIKLRQGDSVVNASKVKMDASLVSIGANGYGKLTSLDEYNIQKRAGYGVLSYKVTDKTGPVIDSMVVEKDEELMIMADTGTIIRISVDQISEFGRNTQGVKLMNLTDAQVSAVATLAQSEEE